MDQLVDHFGESIDLSGDTSASLRGYLVANAADKVADKGAALLLERLDAEKTPVRVSEMPRIFKLHVVMRALLKINTSVKTRNLTNCDGCHQKAAEGSFAQRDLVVPGLTKVIRPGGQF
jgi:hypothetical protein